MIIIGVALGFATSKMTPRAGLALDLVIDGVYLLIGLAVGSPLVILLGAGMGVFDVLHQTRRMRKAARTRASS